MPEITTTNDLTREDIEELLSIVPPSEPNEVVTFNDHIEINFENLARILYEYSIYDDSDESNKIEILETIRDAHDWIEIDDIKDAHCDLNESTIYRNIRQLRDDDLVEKVGSDRSGMYVYRGP